MATARLRRVLSGVRSTTLTRPATGGYDRTHDGLVSGWFTCPACGTAADPHPRPAHRRPGRSTRPRPPPHAATSPAALGFLLRFTPTGTPSAHVRVQCPTHPEHGLDLDVPADTWTTPALAAIEHSTWPIVTGWLALLAAPDGAIRLQHRRLRPDPRAHHRPPPRRAGLPRHPRRRRLPPRPRRHARLRPARHHAHPPRPRRPGPRRGHHHRLTARRRHPRLPARHPASSDPSTTPPSTPCAAASATPASTPAATGATPSTGSANASTPPRPSSGPTTSPTTARPRSRYRRGSPFAPPTPSAFPR